MTSTEYARDFNGTSMPMAHWKWGNRRELIIGTAPARSAVVFEGHLLFVETSRPVHLRLGDVDVAAGTSDPIFKPGAVYAFPRARGEDHLSAVVTAGDTDATLEYREVGSFEEARAVVVPPAGLEPATARLEGGCSIRLSYGSPRA